MYLTQKFLKSRLHQKILKILTRKFHWCQKSLLLQKFLKNRLRLKILKIQKILMNLTYHLYQTFH